MQKLTARSLFLCQVFLLLASILVSSTLLNDVPTDPLTNKYKYYSNKKGTQVVEIGPRNSCQIFRGDDAAWLMENMEDEMKVLNYIQFRLLVGRCQLDAIFQPLFPRPQPQPQLQQLQQQEQEQLSNNQITTLEGSTVEEKKNQSSTANGIEFQLNTNANRRNESNAAAPVRETIENSFNNANELSTTTGIPQMNGGESTPSMPLIFPGTKWCGAGSSARFHEDIGLYVHTDKCCREHDLCPENMEGRECKYGLCNDSDFTRSSCDCDYKFRMCLQRDRSLSSLASFKIANLYFNILKPLCYARRPPVKSCRRHRITGECVDFEFDSDYDQEWQFFPAQPYLSETVEKIILPVLPQLPLLSPNIPVGEVEIEDRVQLLSPVIPPKMPMMPMMQPFSSSTTIQSSSSPKHRRSTTVTATATDETVEENDDEEDASNEDESLSDDVMNHQTGES